MSVADRIPHPELPAPSGLLAENSTRGTLQATYTSVRIPKADQARNAAKGRALEKFAFIAAIKPSREEIAELKNGTSVAPGSPLSDFQRGLELIESTLPEFGTPTVLRCARLFREVNPDTLITIAERLVQRRQEKLQLALKTQDLVARAYFQQPRANAQPGPSNGGPAAPLSPRPAMSVKQLMRWAIDHGVEAEAATQTLDLVSRLLPPSGDIDTQDSVKAINSYTNQLQMLMDGFQANFAVEPIGYLHLERITFTPAGTERGELISSVPLAPGEEVNIAHKEWSNTSQEFERIVTDSLEEYSEQGVTEKSELTQAASSQVQHSSGLNTGVTASGGYGPVNITTSLSANVADSASASEQLSRNNSRTITRNASSRVKKEHKVSFKVASAAGTEDQAVRRFKNPSATNSARVDYYQFVRKWNVNLYRYGVRLTYDLTIPEPGSDIIKRIQEIQDIKHEIEGEFQFDLTPEMIERGNYLDLAAKYNISLSQDQGLFLQDEEVPFQQVSEPHNWTDDQSEQNEPRYFTLSFDIPEDYEIAQADRYLWFQPNNSKTDSDDHWQVYAPYAEVWSDFNPAHQPLVHDVPELVGKFGKVAIAYGGRYLRTLYIEVRGKYKLREETKQRWQLRVWGAIRDAALAQYNEHREALNQKLSRLSEEQASRMPSASARSSARR